MASRLAKRRALDAATTAPAAHPAASEERVEQNFDTPYDKYHLFISRLSGVSFITLICKATVAPPSSQVSSIPNSPNFRLPVCVAPTFESMCVSCPT